MLREQLALQAEHQASAVQRAEELVALEGALATSRARAQELERERDAANTRAQRAEAERNAALARPSDAGLAEAVARAERAEARLARIDQPPEPLEPAWRRMRPRTAAHREWSPQQRMLVVGAVLVALLAMLIVLVLLL